MTHRIAAMMAAIALLVPAPALGAPAELRIIPEAELRFGTFAVIDRGYRIIGANGSVQSSGVFSISNGDTSPARFTVSYDRGNNGRRRLNLRIQLVLAAAPVINQGGLVAQLSGYQTDLPGASTVQPGQIVEILIPNCTQRVCQTTFNVGARLDIESNAGGGRLEIPIPADVVLISVK